MRARQLTYGAITIGLVGLAAFIERALGRVPWCTCGYIKFWHGVVNSSENSQHLTDWYTFSHILHGVGFYFLLWVVAKRASVDVRFVGATALEAGWEVLENTSLVIERYRAATISLQYFGDSIVNSVSDIGAMMLGFWIARTASVWMTIGLILLLEIGVGIIIRDNLTLNILMLIHPVEAIRRWQTGS